MSKRVSQDTSDTEVKSNTTTNFKSISEVSEQEMILDKISENQKKLMKSRAERYKDAQKILENSIGFNNKRV